MNLVFYVDPAQKEHMEKFRSFLRKHRSLAGYVAQARATKEVAPEMKLTDYRFQPAYLGRFDDARTGIHNRINIRDMAFKALLQTASPDLYMTDSNKAPNYLVEDFEVTAIPPRTRNAGLLRITAWCI